MEIDFYYCLQMREKKVAQVAIYFIMCGERINDN